MDYPQFADFQMLLLVLLTVISCPSMDENGTDIIPALDLHIARVHVGILRGWEI